MGAILVAIILGAVQGLTEFMPISSSAHLLIVPWLFGWNTVDGYTFGRSFDFSIHLGTLAALLVYFRYDWIRLFRSVLVPQGVNRPTPQTTGFTYAQRVRGGGVAVAEPEVQPQQTNVHEFGSAAADRRFLLFIVAATIPGGIVGALFESNVETFITDHQSQGFAIIAVTLAALGVLLMVAERIGRKTATLERMNWLHAILIGLAQACAVIPGFSRSGVTITAGLFLGYTREAAARFSFLLATPITAGAGLVSALKLRDSTENLNTNTNPLVVFIVGVATAAIVGYFVIGFLLRFLQRQPTYAFTMWRVAVAALVVLVLFVR